MYSLVIVSLMLGQFTVTNKVPQQQFTVVNKTFSVKARTGSVTFRQPVGHTHTCTTCGTTWDHTANDTHVCKECGGSPPTKVGYDRAGRQLVTYLTDYPAKMVTVRAAPQQQQPVRVIQQRLNGASANCPNGNCPYVR